jgi:hypothetical protein
MLCAITGMEMAKANNTNNFFIGLFSFLIVVIE